MDAVRYWHVHETLAGLVLYANEYAKVQTTYIHVHVHYLCSDVCHHSHHKQNFLTALIRHSHLLTTLIQHPTQARSSRHRHIAVTIIGKLTGYRWAWF